MVFKHSILHACGAAQASNSELTKILQIVEALGLLPSSIITANGREKNTLAQEDVIDKIVCSHREKPLYMLAKLSIFASGRRQEEANMINSEVKLCFGHDMTGYQLDCLEAALIAI